MRKGDIVRRITTTDGFGIGPYLIVLNAERNSSWVQVQPLGKSTLPYKVLKESVEVIKMYKIQITDASFKKLLYGNEAISHQATAAWMKLYKEQARIVQFRNFDFPEDIMIFLIDGVIKRKNLWKTGEDIKIELKERLL